MAARRFARRRLARERTAVSTTTERPDRAEKKPRPKRKLVARPGKATPRPGEPAAESGEPTTAARLRARLALTQAQFAPLLPVSVRSLATLEKGAVPTEQVARRLTELGRLTAALSEVVRAESLGKWLATPNPAFGGLKPVEVIERGESDRIWETIYFLRSGVAS